MPGTVPLDRYPPSTSERSGLSLAGRRVELGCILRAIDSEDSERQQNFAANSASVLRGVFRLLCGRTDTVIMSILRETKCFCALVAT